VRILAQKCPALTIASQNNLMQKYVSQFHGMKWGVNFVPVDDFYGGGEHANQPSVINFLATQNDIRSATSCLVN
jgi:hypothetical protein